MDDERRYDDREVAKILEAAVSSEAAAAPRSVPADHGLTLSQLREIGSEVGIPPARIEAAARAISGRSAAGAPRTFLGRPRSLSRIVPLDRALEDDEWTRLVADLRYTFRAEGRVREHGLLRSWSNGNLQVHVEPDGDRYRVRMQTLKGDAAPLAGIGVAFIGMGAIALLTTVLDDPGAAELVIGALFGAGGLGQLGYVRAMLSRWADQRAAQMEGLAERIPRLLEE